MRVRTLGSGFGIHIRFSRFRVQGSGFRVSGLGLRVQDSRLTAQVSSFRVHFMFSHELFFLGRCYAKGPEGPVVMLLLCSRKSHPLPCERSEMQFAMGYKRNFGPNLIQLPVSSPSDPPYRGTSLIRKRTHPGPYRRPRPRILAGS